MAATLRLRAALAAPPTPGSPCLGGNGAPGATPPQALRSSASTGTLVRSPSQSSVGPSVQVAPFAGSLRSASTTSAVVLSSGSASCRAASGSRVRPIAERPISASAATPVLLTGTVPPQVSGQNQAAYALQRSHAAGPPPSSSSASVIKSASASGMLANGLAPPASMAGATASASSSSCIVIPGSATPGLCSPGLARASTTETRSSCLPTYAVSHSLAQPQAQWDSKAAQVSHKHLRNTSHADSIAISPVSSSAASSLPQQGSSPSPSAAAAARVLAGDVNTGYMPPSRRAAWTAKPPKPAGDESSGGMGQCSHFSVAAGPHPQHTNEIQAMSGTDTGDTVGGAGHSSSSSSSTFAGQTNAHQHGADVGIGISGSPLPPVNTPRLLARTAALSTVSGTQDPVAGEEDEGGCPPSLCSSPGEPLSLVLTSREPRSGEACCGEAFQVQPRLAVITHGFGNDPADSEQLLVQPGDMIEGGDFACWPSEPSTIGSQMREQIEDVNTIGGSSAEQDAALKQAGSKSITENLVASAAQSAQPERDMKEIEGCCSGASTTADAFHSNSNSPNASDVSKEAPAPWPGGSPGGSSVGSSAGQAAKRRQKPTEVSSITLTVEEADHQVEMAACLSAFLDTQEHRLVAEMSNQAGWQRQSSSARLRLLRAKKAAAAQALREAHARARVCRGGAAVKDQPVASTMTSPADVLATAVAAAATDGQQAAAQKRHRQRTERLVERASKRAAETTVGGPPPSAGGHVESRKRSLSRGSSGQHQPQLSADLETCDAPRGTSPRHAGMAANDGMVPSRRMPRAVPPRVSRGSASRGTSSPRSSSTAASPSGMRCSSSMSNLAGRRSAASTPRRASSPRSGTGSPRPGTTLNSLRLPRSLSKLLQPRASSASPPQAQRPTRPSVDESDFRRPSIDESDFRREEIFNAEFSTEAAGFMQLQADCLSAAILAPACRTHANSTEDELREACEALKESERAVSASERRVAALQRAWENAIAADADDSITSDVALSRSPHRVMNDLVEVPRDQCPDQSDKDARTDASEYADVASQRRSPCGVGNGAHQRLEELLPGEPVEEVDDTARLFVEVLHMAQELPARWQEMSSEERSRLLGDFSHVHGLLQPHFQHDGAPKDL